MKYLQRRDAFLDLKKIDIESENKVELFKNSQMIRETFENDITWGGSLIGRLINSTIRYSKILINAQRVKTIIPRVEKCLNELLEIAIFGEEERKKVILVKVQFLLEAILKVIKSKQSVQVKITQLAGDENGDGGLIDTTIEDLEKIESEEFTDKDEIIRKLKAFKESLLELRGDEEPQEGEEEVEETPSEEGVSDLKGELTEFLKSILDLFKFFKKGPEPDKEKGKLTWRGKEVIIVGKGEKKIGAGEDETWNTKDDAFGEPREKIVPPGSIQIVVKNPRTNKFDKDSEIVIVKPTELKKESLLFENVTPEVEKQIQTVKTKIGNSFKNSEMLKYESLFTKLLSDVQAGKEESIQYAKDIMKQVIKNEITEGKPITFQELIKEAAVPFFKTEYKALPKVISLVSRVVLSLKDNMEFLNNLGDSKDIIKSFIENYLKIKDSLNKESEKKEEEMETDKTSEEESQKEEGSVISQSEVKVENHRFEFYDHERVTRLLQEKGEAEKIGKELDEVYTKWRENFTEEEEKKWAVNVTVARELMNKSLQAEKKKVKLDIKNPDTFDRIIEIVELFGKAYRIYATDYIPSGRPGGIISLSTMREYQYIGDDSSRKDWGGAGGGDTNPGEGPWAAKKIFRNFRDGIMGLLKNQQYRRILANSQFVNTGPNQVENAGKNLFTFMNDMLSGTKGNFEKNSADFYAKYFGGEAAKEIGDRVPVSPGRGGTILPGNEGEKGSVSFCLGQDGLVRADFTKNGRFLNGFAIVEGVINGKSDQKMVLYFDSLIKVDKKEFLICKAHIGKSTKQSMITSYFSKTMEDKKLKLDKTILESPNEKVFVLPIEIESSNKKIFKKGVEMNLKFGDIKNLTSGQSAGELKIKPTKGVFILAYTDENKDGKQTQKILTVDGSPDKYPVGDVKMDLGVKIKNDKNIKKKFDME